MNCGNTRSRGNLRFHQTALVVGALGAAIGVIASVVAWRLHGQFADQTFQASLFTLAALYPVYREYQRLHRLDRPGETGPTAPVDRL